MKKWRNYIPEGTRDILFDKCSLKKEIENSIRNTYINSGFHQVETPTIEFYDVFDFKDNGIPQENMYKFFDAKGRILVLRPDYTIPVARVAASKVDQLPMKFFYSGQVFTPSDNFSGKDSEITQAGVEIIGEGSIRSEIELILRAIEALENCGLDNFKIELGESNFYRKIIESIEIDDMEKEKLTRLVRNKNIGLINEFLKKEGATLTKESKDLIRMLPELFGEIDILDKVSNYIPNSLQKDIDKLRAIYDGLKMLGYEKYISIDLGMVSNLNYYTGITIKGYVDNFGEEILSGGRYDKVFCEFGEKTPAAGLAFNINNILEVLFNKSIATKKSKILIHYELDQLKVVLDKEKELITKGYEVELSLYENIEKSKEYGKAKGFNKFIAISKEDIIEEDIGAVK
ncbi:ATP phosphoribosyltransferase regulatory subunit [Clostridium bornimense]|uniref:ATP phosphoribosyltransferase regulatory subunit n=1 Tax=Clostridium bornimense TaxID=1216932 RepID=UPI001C1270EC|nr:ATP phosphoribosyltransferase regulatory subunit [Clostridium bornimense]MBU5315527.1 ATP phosphoribosyltransferase regulatory subunit [Clostridium bornimense]